MQLCNSRCAALRRDTVRRMRHSGTDSTCGRVVELSMSTFWTLSGYVAFVGSGTDVSVVDEVYWVLRKGQEEAGECTVQSSAVQCSTVQFKDAPK